MSTSTADLAVIDPPAAPWATWGAALVLIGVTAWFTVEGLGHLLGAHALGAELRSAETQAVGPVLLAVVAVIFVAECRWPAVPRPAMSRAHFVDAAYLGLAALVAPVVAVIGAGFAVLVERYAPFLQLGRLPLVPRVAVVAVILFGIDAVNWAAHRANHRRAVLWRFHALHHSQEEMSVFTTFRTHPLAHVSYLPAALPALILASSGSVPTTLLVVYGCLVALPHANLRWSYGRLGRWVVSPAFHRLHHAATDIDGMRAVNFGFVLSVWDRLAGTAALPAGRGVIDTGLAGRPVPVEQDATAAPWRTVGRQLIQPFRLHSGLEQRS